MLTNSKKDQLLAMAYGLGANVGYNGLPADYNSDSDLQELFESFDDDSFETKMVKEWLKGWKEATNK